MADMRRRCVWLLAGVLLTARCGSGGSAAPAAPSTVTATTPTSSAEPTVVPPASVALTNVMFTYDANVSASDRSLIERATAIALGMFQARFGRTVTGPVPMLVRSTDGPYVGHGQAHAIDFYLGNAGWTGTSTTSRTRVVVHEMFHILQEEVGWPADPTQWFVEGTAEYIGYAGAFDAGMATYTTIKNCETQIYFTGGGASTPPLETISFGLNSSVNSRYAVAWLAVDRLLGGINGLSRLKGFWEASGAWDQRFQTAFGLSTPAFYADFAKFAPAAPPSNACGNL